MLTGVCGCARGRCTGHWLAPGGRRGPSRRREPIPALLSGLFPLLPACAPGHPSEFARLACFLDWETAMMLERVAVLAAAFAALTVLASVVALSTASAGSRDWRRLTCPRPYDASSPTRRRPSSTSQHRTAPSAGSSSRPSWNSVTQQARVAVYSIDAVAQQDLARFYGVMTVPSTVRAQSQAAARRHQPRTCHPRPLGAADHGCLRLTPRQVPRTSTGVPCTLSPSPGIAV